jgi:hypothetical protein
MGRVRVYLRGRVWYLCHYEDGRRHRPRVGPDRDVARQMVLRSRKESICLVRCRSASWTKARPVHLASRDCARMCRVEQATGATERTTLLSIPLFAGGTGTNTLIGRNAPTDWIINFESGGSVSGRIDGGGGTNTLDYSASTSPVTQRR